MRVHEFPKTFNTQSIKRTASFLYSLFEHKNFRTKREKNLKEMAKNQFYFFGTRKQLYDKYRHLMSRQEKRSYRFEPTIDNTKHIWVIDYCNMRNKLLFIPRS